jgi:hypothetical protein
MIKWAFFFDAPEVNPAVDRMVIERGGMRSTIIAVPDPEIAVQLSVELVAEGVQFIELCGAFTPVVAAKIIEATGGKIPVGIVGYSGGQSVQALARIFS